MLLKGSIMKIKQLFDKKKRKFEIQRVICNYVYYYNNLFGQFLI